MDTLQFLRQGPADQQTSIELTENRGEIIYSFRDLKTMPYAEKSYFLMNPIKTYDKKPTKP